ncbi:hypothetical protein [Marinobacter zhejiangensis]|uniref:2-keto-4-pentenoate hydratase n=1 Tax=Marinobacter zhejiangensis TaxID=488535 RepID=A0A1I4NU09_9GAMM|nr:hypothetical protein [Marinobacter zhejiangensis]SFM18777.1 2-keto-4-pentenoate hydratase [Marinobacter zhejiangensis]
MTGLNGDVCGSLVDALAEAWTSGMPMSADDASRLAPADCDAAYLVHKVLGERLEWWPTGRPRAWKLAMGKPPLAAPVPDFLLELSPGVERSPHSVNGIEVELVVRLSAPIGPQASRDEVEAAIGQTFAAIERFDVRAKNWERLPETFLLADLQMHGGLVVGDGVSGWVSPTCLQIKATGQNFSGRVWQHPMNDPLAAIPWLAGHASKQRWPLQAGDLIATGSWCGMIRLPSGGQISAHFQGVGGVGLAPSETGKGVSS